MTCLDPRLDCIRQMSGEARADLSQRVKYMACPNLEAPDAANVEIQVLMELDDPLAVMGIPGVKVRMRVDNLVTARVTPEALAELEAHPSVVYVERAAPLTYLQAPPAPAALPAEAIDLPRGPLENAGEGAIVGIIDFGCDFTHGDFRDSEGSRILYLWDQTLTPADGRLPPRGFSGGVEFTKADLDTALSEADPFGHLHMPAPDFASHGTHVMGIACGNRQEGPSDPKVTTLAPRADIIFVQPDASDVDILGGFGDSVNIAEAVKYIFDRAAALNRPAVVNMSFGTNSGPHDGTTLVERWIDKLLDRPGRAVVMALGNEHHQRLVRTHSEGRVETGDSWTLYWRVNAGDMTPNEVEIWYGARDIFVLQVILPDGSTIPVVEPGGSGDFAAGDGTTRIYVSNERHTHLNGDNRINLIAYAPPDSQIMDGVWQLRIEARLSRDGTFDAWIERDQRSLRSNPQSNFIGGSYVRRKTLGSIQSARHAVTVSNYNDLTLNLADSTSYGPTRDGRTAPVVAAPGVEIFAANARYRSHPDPALRTPYIAMTGTSMAAPFVAGVVACMLTKNPRLTSSQIKGILADTAKPAPGLDHSYRPDWGFGRLDARAAVSATSPAPPLPAVVHEPATCPPTPGNDQGPYFRENAPFTQDLYPEDGAAPGIHIFGKVLNTDCSPVPDATIHVWQADEHGHYDNDDPANPPPDDYFRCRGRLKSDQSGRFEFVTVLPGNYTVLVDWVRVRHIHFTVSARGYTPVTTQLFLFPDEHYASDHLFDPAVLVYPQRVEGHPDQRVQFNAEYNFVLQPVGMARYRDALRPRF